MAPSFFNNTQPLPSDTELTTWKKILGVLQNQLASPNSNNNPLPSDGLRKTKLKFDAAKNGTTVTVNVSL